MYTRYKYKTQLCLELEQNYQNRYLSKKYHETRKRLNGLQNVFVFAVALCLVLTFLFTSRALRDRDRRLGSVPKLSA
jgi:hypothetical protein